MIHCPVWQAQRAQITDHFPLDFLLSLPECIQQRGTVLMDAPVANRRAFANQLQTALVHVLDARDIERKQRGLTWLNSMLASLARVTQLLHTHAPCLLTRRPTPPAQKGRDSFPPTREAARVITPQQAAMPQQTRADLRPTLSGPLVFSSSLPWCGIFGV